MYLDGMNFMKILEITFNLKKHYRKWFYLQNSTSQEGFPKTIKIKI